MFNNITKKILNYTKYKFANSIIYFIKASKLAFYRHQKISFFLKH